MRDQIKKKKKGVQIGKEEMKLSLFTDDKCENSKNSTKNTPGTSEQAAKLQDARSIYKRTPANEQLGFEMKKQRTIYTSKNAARDSPVIFS